MSSHIKQAPWLLILSGFLAGVLISLGILASLGKIDLVKLIPGLTNRSNSSGGSLEIGEPAPDFELTDLSGKQVRLSDFHDRVVVLNFWATWCNPCRAEMPVLQEAYLTHQDEIVVLGVNFQQSLHEVDPFIDAMELSYPILLDPDGKAARLFQVFQLPNTFFIDRQGMIQTRHIGSISPAQLDEYLSRLGVSE